uniref:Coatomer subunit delta n=1 Tax=Cyprinus carpio TaxID=7962 RepID=A0A8C1I9Y8_CYPCA
MVLLAAAVCTKAGKALVSRQFVEMTRTRVEGLLAAFPKLMNTGKQHTFVETESVRYVYQPLEKLYMVLVTTKNSNILEDLETLRLFSRVIPEYCRVLEESEISEHCFDLIFAFDEIVALGYRENVNLAQIRTFTEMDSHEEKVFRAVRETQEREAKAEMRRKAKELQQIRRDVERGKKGPGFGGFGSSGMSSSNTSIITDTLIEPEKPKPTPVPVRSSGPSKALKLVGKGKEVDDFVDKLKSEGENIILPSTGKRPSEASKSLPPPAHTESVHLRVEEKITLTCGRDGGLQNMEVLGMITLRVSDEKNGRIRLKVNNNDKKGVQLQTHPNVDKKLFTVESVIGLKNPDKSFPLKSDVGVLKWRLQTTDEALIPLTINCWPSESGTGCDVNIEYELQDESLELNDVVISIPVPSGVGAPVIGDLDGEYRHDSRRNVLEWCLPVIDVKNKTGSLEFSIPGQPNDFFPVSVSFVSKGSYCDIQDLNECHEEIDNSIDMDRLNPNVPEHGRQTHQVLQSTPLDLIETGKTLKVQAERPHLVSLGSGRLSTAITLLPLPEGKTTLGHGNTDINIQGPGVTALHCYIENVGGAITLYPCGNQCSMDGLAVTKPVRLTQGCMLCFGQSSFFRFNHPEEALRMKSLMPGGSPGFTSTYKNHSETHGQLNGNHLPLQERPRPGHGTPVRSVEKDLQDIMNSLTMAEGQTSSSEQCKKARHPIPKSAMLNGSGHSLVSHPTSPGTLSVSSSYENTSPPFPHLSTPSVVSSTGSCLNSTNTHSTSYTHIVQAPVPQPRTFASKVSSSNGGLKDQESSRLQKALTETPSSPATNRRGSSSPRSSVGSSVQETSSSLQTHSRALLPPDSPQSSRRGVEPSSMCERPPLSPSIARRGVLGVPVLPGAITGVPLTSRGRTVPDSPRLQRRATAEEEVGNTKLHARSPSPVSALLKDQSCSKQKGGLTPASGSQTGVSPLTSPRNQRRGSREPWQVQPRTRERKNSISEVSDKEEDLLEYHRWQREARMREQEMERLERQRLETILNLCAEYNKSDPSVGVDTGRACQFPGMEEVSVRRPGPDPASVPVQSSHRQRESEEENLKEECSSTESQHQEHEDSSVLGQQERAYLEEERLRVMARVDELKTRVTDLEQQIQESRQEAEMERALLQGERRAELDQVEAELEIINQLQLKLNEVENSTQMEKEKKVEALESATKRFEDLEFRQLERESGIEEEKEMVSRQLLQEKAEYFRTVTKRKEKMATLEIQANQLGLQAAQDCERMAKDRTLALQMLQKEKERLSALETRYQSLTGGRTFSKPANSKETQPAWSRPSIPRLDSERWYQEIMAAGEPSHACPPPLPAKCISSRKPMQIYKQDSELGQSNGTFTPPPSSVSTSGRNTPTKSLPDLSPAYLDLDSKRQLDLQGRGLYTCDDSRIRPTDPKQSHWGAPQGSNSPFPPSGGSMLHHSILHHQAPPAGESTYDTLSLESSDSVETSVSTGNNSACSPESSNGLAGLRLEEMEKMLKEAQQEKARLVESREREVQARKQLLEAERKRREEVERRLQDETAHRQRLVEEEVKLREKQCSQARPMTRYLPIRKEEFDLRSHVESSGHCVDTCAYVIVTEKMCKGHLVKMGGKIKSWKKRWFVFDRLKRTFSYYINMRPN